MAIVDYSTLLHPNTLYIPNKEIGATMPIRIRSVRGVPGYLVGTDGSVWSKWKTRRRSDGSRGVESFISGSMKEIKPRNHSAGYLSVSLRREGENVYFLIHRLVLETFIGPCPEGMEARHLDNDKHNNILSNLCWGTREENVQDSINAGTFYRATNAARRVNLGKKKSMRIRAKISAGLTGKPKSDEHIASLIDAWKLRKK